jgi:hypothetical protein
MGNHLQEMTELNSKILACSNSFIGQPHELENFKYFITDGMSKQLFELLQNTKPLNTGFKENFEEFENLMFNINNLKELLEMISKK